MKEVKNDKILTLKQAAKHLFVCTSTLRNWDNKNLLKACRTKGGHRRYTGKQINEAKEKMLKGIQ